MNKHDEWLDMMTEAEWDELHPDPIREEDRINWAEANEYVNDYVGDGPDPYEREDDSDALIESEALTNDIEWALTRHWAGLLNNTGVYNTIAGGAYVLDLLTDNGHQYRLILTGPLEEAQEDTLG